ncbi:thialysine N-epsilon-acetyltransferase-like [Phymastichus coffea]|uniref:thialysine N-epsilon-acetyltransferase-like n=1 Tax=Phymastichus coffea TaxID=108790 RepID=UPI00273ACEA4|nr:thialysine N-epsilon-acetyltransferase-like [Phymastichus coffea]
MSDETSRVIVREARREDCQELIKLSKEIADFHKHFNSPHVDVKVLEKDLFDTPNPNQGFYVAVIDDNVVGYGHYYYTYTLRLGKNMCLQDLYVQEKFRSHKIGDKLMKVIAKKAKEENIGKIEFLVSDWNPAKNFYLRRGAVDLTIKDEFHVYTFSKDAIASMALA